MSDAPGEPIEGLLPANGHRGGPWKGHRRRIDGLLGALSDGGRGRHLPAELGPWQTAYDRSRKWCRTGRWDKILRARAMNGAAMDGGLFGIDGPVIRAHPSAAGAAGKESARR